MKQTVRDIQNIGEQVFRHTKAGLYYLSIPLVLLVGMRTVNLANYTASAPI